MNNLFRQILINSRIFFLSKVSISNKAYNNLTFFCFIVLGLIIVFEISRFYKKRCLYKDINEISFNNVLPNITIKEMKNKILEIYKNFIISSINCDFNKLPNYTDNSLYNILKSKSISLELQNKEKKIDDLEIFDIKIINIRNENNIISMDCYLKTNSYSYTINKNTQQVTNGSKYRLLEEEILLTLIKYIGKDKITTCPNCGNVDNFSMKNKCKYCDTILLRKPTDFVINKIKKLNKEIQ